jgi:ATP-dependent DNA helicase RecQ
MPTTTDLRTRAAELLRELTGQDARFREHQLEAIRDLVDDRARVLCVQRTGWGKSAVYFIATALLREREAGPTLIVSPLLALMRNQIAAAQRLGIRAHTVNSTNRDAWSEISGLLDADAVDLLLISPERLNNPQFRAQMLPVFAKAVGLLVVDEAHCISDWGHDFRPDYRRIADMLERLPEGVGVLCTTATANDRVVADVEEQLRTGHSGAPLVAYRGPLGRSPAKPIDSPGWRRTSTRCRDRGSSTRSPSATPSRSRSGSTRTASRPRPTRARSRPSGGSRWRTGCWPTT